MKLFLKRAIQIQILIFAMSSLMIITQNSACYAAMNNYCALPPFVAQSVPPLTMLVSGKDHKLFYQAYSDAADLDEDGKLDIEYTHSIDYYGYFDSYKCYAYDSTAGQFNPANTTTDKFCASGQWSGNVLNWLTMSRMDVIRKVLYGGHRKVDNSSSTILQRVSLPMDAHSWGKELTGRLCNNGTSYTHTCYINTDCDSGQTCVDVASAGKYLIPYAASTAPSSCTAAAVGTPVAGKLLVARYQHDSSKGCGSVNDSNSLINSYEPDKLFNPNPTALGAGLVQYLTGFDDQTLASQNYADNYNILVVTNFTADVSGDWQFAVDGDDAVEVQVGGTVVAQYLGCHGFAGNQSHSGTITLTAGQTYSIVARHFEQGGGEGVQVWFKRPGAANWTFVGSGTGLYAPLSLSAPSIPSGSECHVKDSSYVSSGAPYSGGGCTGTVGSVAGDILVTRYQHSSSKGCGSVNSSSDLINSYEPSNLFNPSTTYLGTGLTQYVTGFDDPTLASNNYADNYNILAVTNFTADVTGTWQFAVDGDDAVDVQINGTVVASYYNCHGFAGNQTHSGSINLTAGQTYTLVAHHFEQGGGEGVQVWFMRPGATTWTFVKGVGSGLYAPLTLAAPNIIAGNECAIESLNFVSTGTPTVGYTVTSGTRKQHLFCNTSLSDGGDPLLRVMQNMSNRIWDWSAKERPECNDSSHGGNYPFSSDPTDFIVKLSVCNSGLLESNCRAYGPSTATVYKPAGLLQKYGEGDGTKVCSKSYSTPCTNDTDCSAGDGICIYKAPMYFGLVSGSYKNNLDGGVLRKNVSSILDEINTTNGTFNSSTDGIIQTYENIKLEGYDYGSYYYSGSNGETCGWYEDGPQYNGMCQNWGNPLAEMMYESIRYFAGKGSPLSDFTYSGTTNDSALGLPAPSWGFNKGGSVFTTKPYDIYPTCSRPFMLLMSDVSPSYDADKIPGSTYSTLTEDTALPHLGLGDTSGSDTVLNNLVNTIGTTENIASGSWFIGQSGSTSDNLCTSKTVTNLSTIRGLCPLEPTKQGSYYSAALAYFGKNGFSTQTGLKEINTYSVAISPPFADFKIKASTGYVTFVPTAKSVSGCLDVYEKCANMCSMSYDPNGHGLTISGCSAGSFCPTNQVVNFFVDDVRYDSNLNVIYMLFRINYEDSEQGADHDMDTIEKYEICTQAAKVANYGGCGMATEDLATNPAIKISMWTEYGAGCIDQVAGFIISGVNNTDGTDADGTYLPVKDGDVPNSATGSTPAVVAGMPLTWSKVFYLKSNAGNLAGFLKNPLWYAAKWGGFNDINNNNIPDQRGEWAVNCTATDPSQCDPDNYYLVTNPLKLETQLDKALSDILARTSSGTAASIVNNRGQSGANILSAIFYPQKDFGSNQKLFWLGDLQNYWYYFDPYINNSTVRDDTNPDDYLILTDDDKIDIHFDNNLNKTMASLYKDLDGKGTYSATPDATIEIDDAHPLWRGGYELYKRTAGTRKIYTTTDGANLTDFSQTNESSLRQILGFGASDATSGPRLIDYIRGIDTPSDLTLRNRTVTYKDIATPSPSTGVGVWKLGDIVDSTPKIQSYSPMNGYHVDYSDSTYSDFINTSNYSINAMVYTGANDGMLHAFRLGKTTPPDPADVYGKNAIAVLTNPGTSPNVLGNEEWAFIPENALPYLSYLSNPAYNHIYFVDNSPMLVDASINKPSGCTAGTDYWNCAKKTTVTSGSLDTTGTSWRSVLIGSMGLGGASRRQDQSCNSVSGSLPDTLPNCVQTPLATNPGLGLSSYFALDVTNPESPSLMWEFSDPGLGYSTVDPVIVRINGQTGTGPNPTAPDQTKNGRWFVVFASGPTGPINTSSHQFYGRSDSDRLRIYVVDLNAKPPFVQGSNYWVIDQLYDGSTIPNAFGGSLTTNGIDIDKNTRSHPDFYSTSVVYVGYAKPRTKSYSGTNITSWTDGGILRLATHDSTDPTQWTLSTLIDGVGPVTASIDKLYDDKDTTTAIDGVISPPPALWLYFGTGRYFYRDGSGIDSATDGMTIFGIKEPCYSVKKVGTSWTKDDSKVFNPSCTTTLTTPFSSSSPPDDPQAILSPTLTDQSSDTPNANLLAGETGGWFIKLDKSSTKYAAERVITTPSARTNGLVLFTTFKPTGDVCGYGGETFFWFVDHATGNPPPNGTLKGKVIIQLSTGAIVMVDLSKIINGKYYPPGGGPPITLGRGGRQFDVGAGKPPTPPPASDTLKKPVKKIVQILEK
ncbi:MAG TPA: PA14 domain-containing protein [Geobacteraceae bacterium]|nr:PA14 domain-containing protein [Geobacteraceae bacterium]